ncbi:RNA polymerase sigma factor [Enterococcus olivae]
MNFIKYEKRRIAEFDSFCKKTLRNEAIDIQRRLKKQREREISFSDLSPSFFNQLFVSDEHSIDIDFYQVLDEKVPVQNNKLSKAISKLSNEKKDIILLSYFLEITDKKIGEIMNLPRSTVQYKRSCALKELKEKLEGKNND